MHTDRSVAARRLRRALHDLGLDSITGSEWCSDSDGGIAFASLDARSADRLICALEDLADRIPPIPTAQAAPGQLSFELSARRRLQLRLVRS